MITLLSHPALVSYYKRVDVPTFTFTVARLMHVETGVSPVFPLVFLLIASARPALMPGFHWAVHFS